jgi:hypothetical protein
MLRNLAIVAALGLAAGGCTHLSPSEDGKPLAVEQLRNAEGHVIGTKEVIRDEATGERLTKLSLFLPRVDERGHVVGYEELVRGGSILMDVNGKRIGGRFEDLRSRKSVTIVVLPRDERTKRAAAPSIDELIRIARLDN